MKICIVQTESMKGNIDANINTHLLLINQAIGLGAKIILFPELSITGYEPELAAELVVSPEDNRFDSFQAISDRQG